MNEGDDYLDEYRMQAGEWLIGQTRSHQRHDAAEFQRLAQQHRPRVASQTIRTTFNP